MKIGYASVSTDEQNPDLQIDALKAAGCERIFTDKASGANAKRSELTKCLKALAVGDTLIVWKLDRLGRSLHDLIGLLDELHGKGGGFSVAHRSDRHYHSNGTGYVANGRYIGGAGTLIDSGTHQSGQGCCCPWREDGA